MDSKKIKTILDMGETIGVEFKRCGNGIESDVYETVCSFLNRFGGDIFLGVLDDGTVLGVPEKAAPDMVKNFISCISNPALFTPTVYLSPEIIQYESKTIIHIHVSPGAEVYSYKKVIYDRVDDADVKVTATAQIAQMYIRKQEIFTERKVYPYVEKTDLRLDMLPKLRVMAQNQSNVQGHPWNSMTDDELLKSARLYTIDRVTGKPFDFGQAKPGHEAGSPGYADIEGKFDESTGKVREKYGKSTGKVYEKLNASQKKIIGYVEKNGMITNKEAQKLLNIKESRALKVLRELTNLELLKKEGKSKGTYYVLKNKGE